MESFGCGVDKVRAGWYNVSYMSVICQLGTWGIDLVAHRDLLPVLVKVLPGPAYHRLMFRV